ncbi:MAG TPA: tetratricopeptide repeat protein [Candidatus Sulfotelmatobacter sp.]|nr:tetratricopeptide repeat protein [Candidatus Sulfotelmatobacter sp.]
MTARRPTTVVASACLAVSMTASVVLLRHIDQIRPKASIEDVLYIDSPKMVERASLGFRGLMACIYWTRAVQYFGHRHFDHEQTYNELAPLLEITTTLDPQMLPAYEFGASFLAPTPPNGAGDPARAIELMEYGIAHNPDNWRLYYDLGFVYYTELKDYKKASEVFARGAQVPNAHPFMKVMAAQMAEHAGDLNTARMLWSATFETSRTPDIRQNALEHLRSIQVDEDVTNLQAAVTRFGERTGRLPASMAELAATEHLPGIPVDPDGAPYKLTPEGRVLVETPENFPFITKGMPAGYKPAARPTFHTKL